MSGKWHMGHSLKPQKSFRHWYAHQLGGGPYYNAPMIRDGQPYKEKAYVSDAITEGALAYLKSRQSAAAQPFYLSVHYTAPHSPWDRRNHPADLFALYEDCPFESCPDLPIHPLQMNSAPLGRGAERIEILKGYYAAVTGMDRGVGRILDQLEAMGIRENTLVFFVSDNGMNMGHHGIFGKGNGTFPPNMYEESVKVPALVSRPGHVPEGVAEEGLWSQCDFMPTLLEYLGLENPEAKSLPGRSFAPLLRGRPVESREAVFVCEEYGPTRMVRDREWKYVHRYPYGPHELYNLREDPNEERNRIADPSAAPVRQALKARLDDFFHRFSDPALDGSREPVTGKGQMRRAGPAGQGQEAFGQDWRYVDENGPRPADYKPLPYA
ncbi:MAG: Choline-sulfatase [candidate division BRC1 bacterium ADurb.BinA364]|nr:MAG: Choline-sulfatase [candidate division BRC1 bacterium ADurb.BinA364]